jgi:hypothetical protein
MDTIEQTNTDDDSADDPVLDRASIDRDIAAGAKAFRELERNASLDWTHWSATILGLRGLRSLAFEKAKTNNMKSQAYRDAMSALLMLRKHSDYDRIDKQTRSDCYKFMDRLEDIDHWYASQVSTHDKLRWRHPTTIVKHCPKHLLSGGMHGHNKPKKKGEKKPAVTAETERLKALLLQAIEIIMEFKPDAAKSLLRQVQPADPEDSVADMYATPEEGSDDNDDGSAE